MSFQRGTRPLLGTGLEVVSATVWKRRLGWAGEMALRLGTLASLAEDLGPGRGAGIAANHCKSSSKGSNTRSWSLGALHAGKRSYT